MKSRVYKITAENDYTFIRANNLNDALNKSQEIIKQFSLTGKVIVKFDRWVDLENYEIWRTTMGLPQIY